MKWLVLLALATVPAFGQVPPPADGSVTVKLTTVELNTIARGLSELPYKDAAPVLADLQKQLTPPAPSPPKKDK